MSPRPLREPGEPGYCRYSGTTPCSCDPPPPCGEYPTYSNHGCHCLECRAANRDYHREARKRQCRNTYDVCPHYDELTHGTSKAWGIHNCKCDACVAACRVYNRKAARKRAERARRGQVPDLPPCGTIARYDIWGCRCKLCRRVKAVQRRAGYVKRRDARRAAQQGHREYGVDSS